MTKYNINISTSLIMEAETPAEAVAELNAMREALANRYRLPSDEERDLLLNAVIEDVSDVKPFEE